MSLSGKKSFIPIILMIIVVFVAMFCSDLPDLNENNEYDSADIAWMLASTALVLIMTPGLAYFYGGMVKKKM